MRTTVALVQFEGVDGWLEVVHPLAETIGRREQLLALQGVTDPVVARRLAVAWLAVVSQARDTRAVTPFSLGTDDRPYVDYVTGAATSAGRVMEITVTEDTEGVPVVTPSLQDPLAAAEEAVQRAIKRMADGSGSGSSEITGPVTFPPLKILKPRLFEFATFVVDGPLGGGYTSPVYKASFPIALTGLVVSLKQAGLSATAATVVYNDTAISFTTATIPAGETDVTLLFGQPVYLTSADRVQVAVLASAGGQETCTVQVKAAPLG